MLRQILRRRRATWRQEREVATLMKSLLRRRAPPRQQERQVATLILLRHGQSVWNGATATFTGWCDVALTSRGRSQAREAGELLRSKGYDKKLSACFTSELERAWETAEICLEAIKADVAIERDWRLNERHYGSVQGICKGDAALQSYFGEEEIKKWRRSMHGKPPPLDESHPHYLPDPAPRTESLADCQSRVLQCFEDTIKPRLFEKPKQCVLIAAHSNTLRALMAHVDGVPDDEVPQLHVPNSVPILYRFDEETQQLASHKLGAENAPDSHARWLLSSRNLERLRSAVQPGGQLTRALFDALDEDGDRSLSVKEIEAGIKRLLGDDVVVAGVVKNIVRGLDLADDATITLEEFEAAANAVAADVFAEADKARAKRTEKRHELAREAARAVAERRRRAVGEERILERVR